MKIKINKEMLQTARQQFCLDTCLDWQQYLEQPHQKVYIQKTKYAPETMYPADEGARRCARQDSFFKAIMCMGQLFIAADEEIYDWTVEQFGDCAPEWFCEYGNLRKLDTKLHEYGREIADTHVYYLPAASDVTEGKVLKANSEAHESQGEAQVPSITFQDCRFIWYNQEEIQRFREGNRFTSAICFSPTQPDVLAVAAIEYPENVQQNAIGENVPKEFDQSKMCGMAGVSADGVYLWQIGINVVPECVGRGLATELVLQMKEEVIRRGKVPYYGTSESHTISQTVALKAGFVPAWTEIYVRRIKNEA